MSSARDVIYRDNLAVVSRFAFDSNVAGVFDDMITRSVPIYSDIQQLSVSFAERFSQAGSIILDVGCSSGTTLRLLAERISDASIKICGVDNSEPMLEQCREKLRAAGQLERVSLVHADMRDLKVENASVILFNYTLQFVHPDERQEILRRAFDSLLPGGVLILSEKVSHQGTELEGQIRKLHYEFKKQNGYSDLEIAQKREAIENVLRPVSTEQNMSMLRRAGFREVELAAKWLNFASFVALR